MDEASAGGTVHIMAGTYTLDSMVAIDKSLTIIGTGQSTTNITLATGSAFRHFTSGYSHPS